MGMLPRLGLARRRLAGRREHPAADRPQPAAHAARDLGHGRSPISGSPWRSPAWPPNSAFTSERLAVVRPGETLSVGPWLVRLQGVAPAAGPNWTAIEAELRATRGDGVLDPQAADALFHRPADGDQRSGDRHLLERPALHRHRQAGRCRGGWQLRLWWKPFVTLIWLGGALIALGGVLALLGRVGGRARRAPNGEERYA